MFLPTTQNELKALGWKSLDVILITGDTYIDSSYIGVAVIGKVLLNAGFRVGIIAQPDIDSNKDITRLGEPDLFWGVTSGCLDSMISNYTSSQKRRRRDDLTAGGENTRRPDLAVIAYSNLIRKYYKRTKPIVLGGIEASLRRISHYHFWTDSVRRSILFDAKADILVYGMGEKTVLELAVKLRRHQPIFDTRGICYPAKEPTKGYIELPPHMEVVRDKHKFGLMFQTFYENTDPFSAKGLYQQQDTRYLIQNPPQLPMKTDELDQVYELDYERDVHPFYRGDGEVRAMETIRFSITSHRGCYGECNFCAIAAHQGRAVIERSEASLLKEAAVLTRHPEFKGIIQDVGRPTAKMYGSTCKRKKQAAACRHRRCLLPTICSNLSVSHERQIRLLRKLRKLPKIRKVFIGSGIRHDLILADKTFGSRYLKEICKHHVSGQLKIAPEHCVDRVLHLMGKPGAANLAEFKRLFDRINTNLGAKQFLTCYLMAAHPGCTLDDMDELRQCVAKLFGFVPEQIQIFTPSPSTYSTLMYYTQTDPESGGPIFVEKKPRGKEKQKRLILGPKTSGQGGHGRR